MGIIEFNDAVKARIAAAIREQFPTATRYGVESSDQGYSGYLLTGVGFDDETVSSLAAFRLVADQVDDDLLSLGWGAFGDSNAQSAFEVDLATGRMIRVPCPASTSASDLRLRNVGGYDREGSPSESGDSVNRAKVKLGKGPASAHELPEERILEFSDGRGSGGLLSLRRRDDGSIDVEVYRSYGKVRVLSDAPVTASKLSPEVERTT